MDAVAHMGHMMENELTVLLRCCRHALAASQYSRTPQPRARMLGRCSVDELRHAATDRSRRPRRSIVGRTISASEYALLPTAHPGVSVATPDRPTGLHLIRIIQGSILGLLGVPARRRDDVGSRPTAAGGLTMYRP